MSVPLRFVLHQRANVAATLSVLSARKGAGLPSLPGPTLTSTVAPPPPELVAAYVRTMGGRPEAWGDTLPPHLFPQWGWPLLVSALRGLPYDLSRMVNAGFLWERRRPLPAGEPLELAASLQQVDDDGRRAVVTLRFVTGTASAPEALVCDFRTFLPLAKKAGGGGGEKPRVPDDARPVAELELPRSLGWDFAKLTGDPNPIHYLGFYAKMAGFKGIIAQGFCQGGLAAEALIRGPLCGDADALRSMEARFTRPLVLPGAAKVFTRGSDLFLGTEPGGPANLVGAFNHV